MTHLALLERGEGSANGVPQSASTVDRNAIEESPPPPKADTTRITVY